MIYDVYLGLETSRCAETFGKQYVVITVHPDNPIEFDDTSIIGTRERYAIFKDDCMRLNNLNSWVYENPRHKCLVPKKAREFYYDVYTFVIEVIKNFCVVYGFTYKIANNVKVTDLNK